MTHTKFNSHRPRLHTHNSAGVRMRHANGRQTLLKIVRWFARDLWFPQFQPQIVCHLFQWVNSAFTKSQIMFSSICQNLQAPVRKQMNRNQLNTFQNNRMFRELNSDTLAELPSKLIRQTLALTWSSAVILLQTLACNSCRQTISLVIIKCDP